MTFNPYKLLAGIFTITLTFSLLGFTHYQAFRLGTAAMDNPLAHTWQMLNGTSSTTEADCPCPHQDEEEDGIDHWFEELYEAGMSHDNPQ